MQRITKTQLEAVPNSRKRDMMATPGEVHQPEAPNSVLAISDSVAENPRMIALQKRIADFRRKTIAKSAATGKNDIASLKKSKPD